MFILINPMMREKQIIEIVTDHANLTFSSRNSTDVQRRKLRFLSKFDYKLIWKAGEDNVVPDALSRIFGEIASRIEESEGVQIMNDQENAASASVLAQEASEVSASVLAQEASEVSASVLA